MLICVVFVLAVIGYAGWQLYMYRRAAIQQAGPSLSTTTPSTASEEGEIVVSGKVQLAQQGPTDEITGYKPTSATLAIGDEDSFTAWRNNPARKEGGVVLSDTYKPSDIRISETEEGIYSVTLKRNTDVICIVNPTVHSMTWDAPTNQTVYSFHGCKKFITAAASVQADITLMAFGGKSIGCDRKVCRDYPFKLYEN